MPRSRCAHKNDLPVGRELGQFPLDLLVADAELPLGELAVNPSILAKPIENPRLPFKQGHLVIRCYRGFHGIVIPDLDPVGEVVAAVIIGDHKSFEKLYSYDNAGLSGC